MNDSTSQCLGGSPPIFAAPLYLLSSCLFLALHLLTLTVFLVYEEYRRLSCFRIMFSIGVLNTIQLLCIGINGLGMLFGWHFGGSGWAVTLIGSLLNASFAAVAPQHLLLAVNRLIVVRQMRVPSGGDYSRTSRGERLFVWTGLAMCWLFAVAIFSYSITPSLAYYTYDEVYDLFSYHSVDRNATLTVLVLQSTNYTPIVLPAIAFFIYLAVVVDLAKRVR